MRFPSDLFLTIFKGSLKMKLYRIIEDDKILWYGFNLNEAETFLKNKLNQGRDVILQILEKSGF
jgi:hypothetical protein